MPNNTVVSDCWHHCPSGSGTHWPHVACHLGQGWLICQLSRLEGREPPEISELKPASPDALEKLPYGGKLPSTKPNNFWSFLPLWRLRWSVTHGTHVNCCATVGKLWLTYRDDGSSVLLFSPTPTNMPGVRYHSVSGHWMNLQKNGCNHL